MMHFTSTAASSCLNPYDPDAAAGDAPRVGTSPSFPWSLPPDEVEKMERLERGERLRLSPTVEQCLNRLGINDGDWPAIKFARACSGRGGSIPPSDDELRAIITEVPLCLLNGRQRLQALAVRQHGWRGWEQSPDFDPQEGDTDLIIAILEALDAARGQWVTDWASGGAGLARWESGATSPAEAQARASGGRALRRVAMCPSTGILNLHGHGLTRAPAARFALPPRPIVEALNLGRRELVVLMGTARPWDRRAMSDAMAALVVPFWNLELNDSQVVPAAVVPEQAVHVNLDGDPQRCVELAEALAARPRGELREVQVHRHHGTAALNFSLQVPDGWRVERSRLHSSLTRRPPPPAPAPVLAYWGSKDPETLKRRLDAQQDGPLLLTFLEEARSQLEAVSPLVAPALREEMLARSQVLLQRLAEEPAMMSELAIDLSDTWPCIDAKRRVLDNMEMTLLAGSGIDREAASLLLLRSALRHRIHLHVSITDRRAENLERGLALEALLDLRLAQITGKSFAQTGAPVYRSIAGMRDAAAHAAPTLEDWSAEQRATVEQILGDEVRAGFPALRGLMASDQAPASRAMAQLLLDPSYQAANAALNREFLAAEADVDDDPSDAAAARRYQEIQERMPRELARRRFELMDVWLAPMREAFAVPPRTGIGRGQLIVPHAKENADDLDAFDTGADPGR